MDDETTADDEAGASTDEVAADDGYDLQTPGLTIDELVAVLI